MYSRIQKLQGPLVICPWHKVLRWRLAIFLFVSLRVDVKPLQWSKQWNIGKISLRACSEMVILWWLLFLCHLPLFIVLLPPFLHLHFLTLLEGLRLRLSPLDDTDMGNVANDEIFNRRLYWGMLKQREGASLDVIQWRE